MFFAKAVMAIALVFASAIGHCNSSQEEINAQVWMPFKKAIMAQDSDAFLALHSEDLVRAEIDNDKVMNFDEYRKDLAVNWPKWKRSLQERKSQYVFELRFLERISNGELSYETGYFKSEVVSGSGDRRTRFGKFHVALRRESGVWKILLDSDSDEGGTISAQMFHAAKSIEP